jgi:hypothetical protein
MEKIENIWITAEDMDKEQNHYRKLIDLTQAP